MKHHLFRHESGQMIAALTRLFGVHNLPLAEDVVQDAFCRALEVWRRDLPGTPRPLQTSPVVALNPAIAIAERDGPDDGISKRISRNVAGLERTLRGGPESRPFSHLERGFNGHKLCCIVLCSWEDRR